MAAEIVTDDPPMSAAVEADVPVAITLASIGYLGESDTKDENGVREPAGRRRRSHHAYCFYLYLSGIPLP